MKIVVLISGSGSNLQALIDACNSGKISAEIAAVISNKAGVFGLQRAEQRGIPTAVIDHKQFSTREEFDAALSEKIDSFSPQLVVLAGFMRILTAEFVEQYIGRMLNIHPSLLPKYQGLHTHRRAIEAGDSLHGVTVHFVTAELDGGPSIIQAQVKIQSDDDETSLAKRVLIQEHMIYPKAVGWFIDGKLRYENGKAILDDEILPESGVIIPAE